jgi:hypothetical protein
MDAGEGRRGLRRRLLLQALLPAEHNNKTLTGNSRANWYIERGHLAAFASGLLTLSEIAFDKAHG